MMPTDDLQNPVLPRYSACIICRKRKLRCDAAQPACGRCCAANQKCEYQPFEYKNKMKILQARIREMEAKIQTTEQQRNSSVVPIRSPTIRQRGLISTLAHEPLLLSNELHTTLPSFLSNFQPLDFDLFPSYTSPTYSSGLTISPNATVLRPPPGVIQRLLEVFMLRRSHTGFELHIGRVIQGLYPDSTMPTSPALIYAMLLVACHFEQEPGLKSWENILLNLTKSEIEVNIAQAYGSNKGKYNPLHHLQAMSMLGQYFYFKGRMLEGYVHISQAVRFALALGVHQIYSRNYYRPVPTSKYGRAFGVERWRPRDGVELGEAINLWWACATRDLGGSIVNGLPPSVSLGEIKTVWPRLLSDFENSLALPDDDYSVASLLDPGFSRVAADVSHDSVNCALAKACILLYTAGKLDIERLSKPCVTDDWWVEFEQCDYAMQIFLQTTLAPCTGRSAEEVSYRALVRTMVECGVVQLHCALAGGELVLGAQGPSQVFQSDSYRRCVDACRSIVSVTIQIRSVDMSYIHIGIGANWMCAAQFLARHLPRLRGNGDTEQALEFEQLMMELEEAMDRLAVEYPVMSAQADQLRTMRN